MLTDKTIKIGSKSINISQYLFYFTFIGIKIGLFFKFLFYTIFFKLTQVKLSILLSLGIISNLFVNIGNFLESQHSIGNDLLFFFNLTTDVVETFSNQFFNQILFKTFAAGREIFLPEINGISD